MLTSQHVATSQADDCCCWQTQNQPWSCASEKKTRQGAQNNTRRLGIANSSCWYQRNTRACNHIKASTITFEASTITFEIKQAHCITAEAITFEASTSTTKAEAIPFEASTTTTKAEAVTNASSYISWQCTFFSFASSAAGFQGARGNRQWHRRLRRA